MGRRIGFVIGLLFFVTVVSAKIQLPSVLADGMVLQQQAKVKLWGKASFDTGIKVKTSWDNKTYMTKSGRDGSWEIQISTPVAGGPYEIMIDDGECLVLRNILIGEVWLCSGQSNMEVPMRGFPYQPVLNSNKIITKSNPSTPIRIYTSDMDENGNWTWQYSKKPQNDCIGRWMDNSSENVAYTSAVAYLYARYLQEALKVPVGIIVSTLGGTQIEAWMSREALADFPEIALSHLDDNKKIERPHNTPCVLYNAKLAPLTNFVVRGFLWYQGESNRGNVEKYARLFPAFVKDLRDKWGLGALPFYYVQIAPYRYDNADDVQTALMREVQLNSMSNIPNSGMVTTMDVGDIDCIHPANKEVVAERLAYWALAKTYGKKGIVYSAPVYKSMEIKDGKIYITFDDLGYGGLIPVNAPLKSFEIAGTDKVFHPAKAVFDTKTKAVIVWSDEVEKPVAARYAFKNYAEASLFSTSGIPVSSFRTDNW
ncbi:putative sialic acid-specific acetylesterase [Tannerella sp. CAG:118]|nr:putative sialic acid-specific acetylesterase [Tannerella sp. CAG:118]